MIDKIKAYSKSISAFLATASAFAAAVLLVPGIGAILPAAWITVLGIIAAAGVVAGVVAGAPANTVRPEQVAEAATQVAVSVAKDASKTVREAITDYVAAAATQFPQPAKAQVQEIGNQLPRLISNTVDGVVQRAIEEFQKSVKR